MEPHQLPVFIWNLYHLLTHTNMAIQQMVKYFNILSKYLKSLKYLTTFLNCFVSGDTTIIQKSFLSIGRRRTKNVGMKSFYLIDFIYELFSLNMNQWKSHWLYQWKYINWWISVLIWFHRGISEHATWT